MTASFRRAARWRPRLAAEFGHEGGYAHNARWGDGNGFSHVRSALLKTSIALLIACGELVLRTWQQVVVISLDNRAREREIVAVVTGV